MSGLLRSSVVFSAMTLLSRIAGFVRDMLQGMLFGTGGAMSAFIVAYRIPNFLRRVFAEGSMAMAFVPVLNEIRQRGDKAALKDFIDHMAGALCAVVLVVAAAGVLLAPLVAGLFTPGWTVDEPEKFAQASAMLRVTFPYLVFISMMALAASILNSFGKFGLPAFTPVLHNLTMIAAMFWLAPRFDVPPMGLAWGVLIAGALQLVLLWPAAAFGVAVAVSYGFRLVFALALAMSVIAVASVFFSAGGVPWPTLFERLEPLAGAAFVLLAVSRHAASLGQGFEEAARHTALVLLLGSACAGGPTPSSQTGGSGQQRSVAPSVAASASVTVAPSASAPPPAGPAGVADTVPITLLGLSLPEDGYHGPNESFAWGQAEGGMLTFVRYFERLAALARG